MDTAAPKKAICRLTALSACALVAAGIAATTARAQQGLKPEPPPASAGGQLAPDPAPGAVVPEASHTSSPSVSSFSPLASVPSTGTAAPAVRASSSGARHARVVTTKKRPTRAAPDRPLPLAAWIWRGAESAFVSARASAPPASSTPLLAAGLALIVLVIGEATFLGLAANVFGIPARRQEKRRRYAEASYPIRQVFPRR
jgi:hypothetical protein